MCIAFIFFFFFFNDTPPTEIYTLSLHDALPIYLEVRDTGVGISAESRQHIFERFFRADPSRHAESQHAGLGRSEEHTSELQSRQYLVCRLLLEKKNNRRLHTSVHSAERNLAVEW